MAIKAGLSDEEIVEVTLDGSRFKDCGIYEHCIENGGEKYVEGQIERALDAPPEKGERKPIRLILLRHEFLRRDGPAIGALQQGHRDRVLTRAPISRRRMVAIEFGM